MNVIKSLGLGALTAASVMAAVPAEAVVLRFTLTGDINAVWNINQNPTPDVADTSLGFTIYDVQVNWPVSTFQYWADADFIKASEGGGFGFFNPPYVANPGDEIFSLFGAQLYTGSELSPTFLLGDFTLFDAMRNSNYNLNIAECTVCTAVPEPDTWAMMLLGFGAVGGALRSRRRIAGAVSKVKVTFA